MVEIIETLIANGWNYSEAKDDPNNETHFPEKIPQAIKDFWKKFEKLSSPSEVAWFFSYWDYLEMSDSAFAWNEFELNGMECAVTEDQKELVVKFWKNHFPFAMSVKDDYKYLAIGINQKNLGQIFIGENSDEDEITLISKNMDEFLMLVRKFYRGEQNKWLTTFW